MYHDETRERIERMYQTKRTDIKWLNALNNATQLVSSIIPTTKVKKLKTRGGILQEVRTMADWYYEQYAIKKTHPRNKTTIKKSEKNIKKLILKVRRKMNKI